MVDLDTLLAEEEPGSLVSGEPAEDGEIAAAEDTLVFEELISSDETEEEAEESGSGASKEPAEEEDSLEGSQTVEGNESETAVNAESGSETSPSSESVRISESVAEEEPSPAESETSETGEASAQSGTEEAEEEASKSETAADQETNAGSETPAAEEMDSQSETPSGGELSAASETSETGEEEPAGSREAEEIFEPEPVKPMFSDPEPIPEEPAPRSRMGWAVAAFLAVLVAGAYVHGIQYYKSHFLPGSYIMGQDVGDMTAEEAVDALEAVREVPVFRIHGREGAVDELDLNKVGLVRSYKGIPEAISAQKNKGWIFWRRVAKEIPVSYADSYDENALRTALSELPQFSEDAQNAPTDAFVSYDGEQDTYVVVPETEGNTLIPEAVEKIVGEAILKGELETDIESRQECYQEPELRQNAEVLVNHAKELSRLHSLKAGVDLGADTEIRFSGEQLLDMISHPETMEEYVNRLADRYDTYEAKGQKRFVTHDGRVIYIENNYGWQMDREATLAALTEMVALTEDAPAQEVPETDAAESTESAESAEGGSDAGDVVSEEPQEGETSPFMAKAVWKKEAASHGRYDYGTMYAEADLTAQKVFVYQDRKCIFESNCVSGRMTKGRITPSGIYDIKYKQKDKVLRGFKPDGTLDYASPVSYWMPFNGGIGFHDATWRGSFGGSIYVYSGSHGCVNLPFSKAKELFGIVYKGMPVIVYY